MAFILSETGRKRLESTEAFAVRCSVGSFGTGTFGFIIGAGHVRFEGAIGAQADGETGRSENASELQRRQRRRYGGTSVSCGS